MLEGLARAIFGLLLAAVVWLAFIPVGFVLATPIILLIVMCRREGTFKDNLAAEYRRWWRVCRELGVFLTPPW
jgi:hypothetical protein